MAPSITTALPPFPPTDVPPLLPTTPPNPLAPVILDKRQTYVTVSVMKNTTSSTDDSTTAKKSSFPVAIAIPALVGGMALALAGFGIWFWWTRKMKRERRAAWEARQRRKRKRAEQSARPSVSSGRGNSSSTTTTAGSNGGPKSPISEKGFVPPVPALPKYAVQQGQDPFKERGYGYNNPSSALAPASGGGGGAFGYATQPGFETGSVTYGYDQYGQPIPQFDSGEKYGHAHGYDQDKAQAQAQPHGYHRRSVSNDSSNPSNPFGSNAYPAEKQSVVPSVVEPDQSEPEPASPTKEQQAPARTEKSCKRAQARMAVAESAAANASVDPAYRHQPKKPSPLALAAAQKKAAEAEAEAEARAAGTETLAPPGYGNQPSGNDASNRQVSGEWGVALGSPNNDGQFDINRRPSQSQSQVQHAVRQASASVSASGYNDDPYLQQQRAKSGQYSEDPYAAYHGGDEEQGPYDDDVYHRAAEGMGLGGRGGNAPKASRWV
ncbi:hypothetical protein I317_04900 [Kwoniella heveanensis CBS 569]|nr:hypothetical protein I317_04900 [Kwoniella heveanensis CBS 569]